MKRLICLILTAAILLCLLPAGVSAAAAPDYAQADRVFAALYAALDETADTDTAQRVLLSCPDVAPDTIIRAENELTWETADGIACRYSPALYELVTDRREATGETAHTRPASKSAGGEARDICLFGPFYGLDDSFETAGGAYDTWGRLMARFTGGSYGMITQRYATIDALADAVESCAVVLIDSHGQTNESGTDSYICLNTGDGLTYKDYEYDRTAGVYHASYGGRGSDGVAFYLVDGTAITNHMETDAPANLVWNGTCLGMSTEGICAPLLKRGVDVVYGYSREVSFDADRSWMDAVMDELTYGRTMAQAVADMKQKWGAWDNSMTLCVYYGWDTRAAYTTEEQARQQGAAFPVVVSANDRYPANPDAVQTVYSAWQLPRKDIWLHLSLPDGVKSPDFQAYLFFEGTLPTPAGRPRDESRDYRFVGWSLQPLLDVAAKPWALFAPGAAFSFGYADSADPLSFGDESATLYGVYTYVEDGKTIYTTVIPDGSADPYDPSTLFSDMAYGTWYYSAVRYGIAESLVNGYTDGTFHPEAAIRRSEVVTILYRVAGSPEVTASDNFSDVPAAAWYANAVAWAAENGVVQGYADGTFRAEQPVTRAQLATLLCRYSGGVAESTAADAFPDAGQIPQWALDAMRWAVDRGLINGNRVDGVNYLQPTRATTRAQFVAVLQRYLTAESEGGR